MEIGDERGTDPIDAWRRGMGRRGGGGSFFFSRRKRKRREGGWVQAVAPRDGRLVSCRGDGSLCFGPANERNGIGEPLDVNSRLPMGSLRMFSLWHRFDGERRRKIGRLLKLEVVVFTTASTAAQQEQEEQEEKEVAHDGITFPFFPRRPHPDSMVHQQFLARPSPVQQARMAPMAPWTLVLRGLPCHGRVCRSLSACQQACFCSEIAARTAKLHCKATPEINQREPRLGWWARRCGWQGTRLAGR